MEEEKKSKGGLGKKREDDTGGRHVPPATEHLILPNLQKAFFQVLSCHPANHSTLVVIVAIAIQVLS